MKKLMLVITLLFLYGCVNVGEFPENRERMHNYGNDNDYCQQHPKRCFQGMPW